MARAAKKSVEERVSEIDALIVKKEQELKNLKEKREKLLHPINMRDVLAKAKEKGLDPREVAEMLGIDL